MNTTDQELLMFKTPALASVPNDVALKFRATLTTSALACTDTDDVIVSIDRQAATPDGYIFEQTARASVPPGQRVRLGIGTLRVRQQPVFPLVDRQQPVLGRDAAAAAGRSGRGRRANGRTDHGPRAGVA
ncbi:hypothetical protein LP419_08635 [Massilia sp. H-1]|nr:hypothetical protein LP419_08635 [Massilia sp. H-1]